MLEMQLRGLTLKARVTKSVCVACRPGSFSLFDVDQHTSDSMLPYPLVL
jgi:hypothetical protein